MKSGLIAIFLLLCTVLSTRSGELPRREEERMDSMIRRELSARAFPGAAFLCGTADQTLYTHNYGTLDYTHTVPVTDSTLYDVASCTKVLSTTFVLMRLYDQKKISLERTVGEFLPQFAGTPLTTLTIQELLTHTSGLKPTVVYPDLIKPTHGGYLTQQVGPGFRYNNKKVMVIGNLSYQYSTLAGDQQFPKVTKTSADFNNLVYMALLDVKFNPTNTLRAMLRSSTNNPSVTQLQDVLDVSNPLFVSQGNPNLRPVYANRMFVRYVNTNVTKGRTFMAMLGGSMQSNYISNATVIAGKNGYEIKDPAGNTVIVLNQGAQYSRPVNMNGYWNVNGMMSYGLPVSFLKSNLNVNLGINYAATPNIFNEVKSTTNTTTYTAGAVLGSNISEKLDFTLGYDVGYNVASNKVRKESNNRYVNQQVSGNFKWITWAGITLQANGSYLKYSGITDSFVEDYFLLNASIGKKIFKHQRGEINVSAYDLLNQNKSFSRNVTATYIENVKTNVLGRYFSINLIYNLRRFGGKNVDASSTRRGETPDSLHDGRPPMGRPPMGPPPGGHRGPM